MRQDRTGTRFEGQDRPVGPCYPRPALGARSGGVAWHRRGPAAGISADLPQPIRGPLLQRRAGRRFSGREGHRVRTRGNPPRQLADFRRSGTVEALTGHVKPGTLSANMANSISDSIRLHRRTYAAVQLASLRQVDEARRAARAILREQGWT